MNRREILKGLGAFPFSTALSGFGHGQSESQPYSVKTHTLQVLLEGAFAVVIQRGKTNRVTAFVPRDPEEPHVVYFNDPTKALKDENYHFELSEEGIKKESDPYINPGFRDFDAHTQVWNRKVENAITLELPFPNSINFSGRPLKVIFRAGFRRGTMPTGHILEYKLSEVGALKMACQQLGGPCSVSTNCPPGIARFYFGARPTNPDNEHAVKFFNFMLKNSFPELVTKYSLRSIQRKDGDADDRAHQTHAFLKGKPLYMPASVQPKISAELHRVSATLDCQSGGIIVNRP